MALRVLSGIGVPMIASILVLAIKKCASDSSPYVCKAAALAIPKCYQLDESQQPALISIISTLLRDRSPLSLGASALAFQAVCPTRLDLLHHQYRRLCRMLCDMDGWGQVEMLDLLLRYARTMLPKPLEDDIDPDLQLLLTSSDPLLQSRNSAVVLAVTRLKYYLAPSSALVAIVYPILRLLRTSPTIERVALSNVLCIAQTNPVSTSSSSFVFTESEHRM